MRGIGLWQLIVLTGLALVGQRAGLGYQKPDRPAKDNIEFQLYRDYLIVVQGQVGPLKGLNFLLDTGTTTTVLSPQVARKLHLDVTPMDVAVLSGNVKGGSAAAPSLAVGPIRRENVQVVIENLSFLDNALPFPVDAIIGLDVLGPSTFVIDYSSREIRFGPAPWMPNSIPLQLKNGLAFVDARVNHEEVRLLVDTGASSMVVFEKRASLHPGVDGGAAAQSPKEIGNFDRRRQREISVGLGEVEFGHEPVFTVPSVRDAGHDFDGLMSPVALGITKVAVDLNGRTLRFAR